MNEKYAHFDNFKPPEKSNNNNMNQAIKQF